jgi:hypothetical protein
MEMQKAALQVKETIKIPKTNVNIKECGVRIYLRLP